MRPYLRVRSFGLGLGLAAIGIAASLLAEGDAAACGGAFFDRTSVEGSVPTGSEAVAVTDHRMIVSIERGQTVLYDQVRFSGHPKELAWVLPVKGTVKPGISSDALFDLLDETLPLTITAPRAACPGCSSSGGGGGSSGGGGGGCGSSADGASYLGGAAGDRAGLPQESENPVKVKNSETVGPYDTVQLSSDDPEALAKWLADNGYAIPKSFEPTLATYVAEKFDFLALKLRPGADVAAIRPIRIAFDGASLSVPMRASAAGPIGNFGITMYVVAESAYAPANYPVFTLPIEKLSWDWAAKRSNYLEVREATSAASGYAAWEVEAAESRSALGTKVTALPPYEGRDVDAIALGQDGVRVVTRLHTTIAPSQLTKDVVLEPFANAPIGARRLTRSIGAPLCETFDSACNVTGKEPTPAALGGSNEEVPRAPGSGPVVATMAILYALFRPRKRVAR